VELVRDPHLPSKFTPNPLPDIDENYGVYVPGQPMFHHRNSGDIKMTGKGPPKTDKKDKQQAYDFMQNFKTTYCRPGVRVYFLGLFDCVNSVGPFTFTRKRTPYVLHAPARHIRHALSLHERRAMFRPSLLLIDKNHKEPKDTFKEVWFAGNHGDVGGGWWLTHDDTYGTEKYLLSDIPLKWMVAELRTLEKYRVVSFVPN
jgi:Uncharacterized alpha/beta hydrolase domain (DUF2235)